MTDDLRASLRERIAESLRNRTLLDGNPARINDAGIDHFTDLAFDALKDGGEWLMTQAEQYQARAHTAEKALAARQPKPDPGRRRYWQVRIDKGAVLCALVACAGASVAQWLTGSVLVGDLTGLPVLAVSLAVLVWRRHGAGGR